MAPALAEAPDRQAWQGALEGLGLQARIRWEAPLQRLNTWRIGGPATCLVDVTTPEDLSQLLPFIREHRIPWTLLGKGSNLLIPEAGWPGLVLHLAGDFKSFVAAAEARTVFAGAALADVTFAQRCQEPGWGGMEFLVGIPGTIGGAVAMNAGAHGGEVADFLLEAHWFDLSGTVHQTSGAHAGFRYRHSHLNGRNGIVVTGASFRLKESDPEAVRHQLEHCLQFREARQPRQPSCGSVFKNPPGDYAARLIEASGLKGVCRGAAQVSEKHANFIINQGAAQATEVEALIAHVQEQVQAQQGVWLETEVQWLQPLPFETTPPAA